MENKGGAQSWEKGASEYKGKMNWIPPVKPNKGAGSESWNSGEAFHPLAYGGTNNLLSSYETANSGNPGLPSWENAYNDNWWLTTTDPGYDWTQDQQGTRIYSDSQELANYRIFRHNVLCQGDEASIVWTASSGGKTQTLTKTTVQSDGEACSQYN
jgi:hypothetical protein